MSGGSEISKHPRAESLRIREQLTRHVQSGVVSFAGLIAHGRGEAFDYLLGEKTIPSALKAIKAAAGVLLIAKKPVLSVNGNAAALCSREIIELAEATDAKLEVNLYHRLPGRDSAIEKLLKETGAREVLGVGEAASARIEEVHSDRRRVDPKGILIADTVFVPLEDGDRTEALRRMGKTVITVDLNPLSRTAQLASITIVDNIVRAMPILVSEAKKLKSQSIEEIREKVLSFDNREAISDAMRIMEERLRDLSLKGVYIDLGGNK
ncbi:phosphopantothenate/pantothenate synthetase [Candidatus Bathyarchaeota archaeon]|nr:phosphopantothenate/pantothenate synthetase [Candidatus Bathyarchaeota archaeon]